MRGCEHHIIFMKAVPASKKVENVCTKPKSWTIRDNHSCSKQAQTLPSIMLTV